MKIIDYDAARHYDQVAALWELTLGDSYPVTDRVLCPRIQSRPSFEPGDGLVVTQGRRVVGFGILEFDRTAIEPVKHGSIEVLMLAPECQRQGWGRQLLARLEDRLRRLGCEQVMVGCGPYRFWSGVPTELAAAIAFFKAAGYESTYEAIDLVGPLADFQMTPESRERLAHEGVTVTSTTPGELGALYDLLTREAAGWRESMLKMATSGDLPNVLVVKHGAEIIGSIQTYTPQSRWRGANVVWERKYGPDLGGFGAVLIAAAWRKRGLGVAMCQAAAQHVKDQGGSHCYIDWTGHGMANFYGKVGAKICGTFSKFHKKLPPA